MVGFDDHVVLKETTATAPALAVDGDRLHLAWTGTDTRLNTLSSTDGEEFDGKRTWPARSSKQVTESSSGPGGTTTSTTRTVPLSPALAVYGEDLHIAWTGTDRRVNVWDLARAADGEQGHRVLAETSPQGPALAAHEGLVLSWTGTDRRLNLVTASRGQWGSAWTLGETSDYGPAIGAAGGELAMAWTGTDTHLNLLWTRDGAWGTPVRLAEKSFDAPALGTVGDGLVLAWTGTNRRLNVLTVRPGEVGPARKLEATSPYSPAVCEHAGRLAIAWTGTDSRVNVARLVLQPS
jgi:hypothetical protein